MRFPIVTATVLALASYTIASAIERQTTLPLKDAIALVICQIKDNEVVEYVIDNGDWSYAPNRSEVCPCFSNDPSSIGEAYGGTVYSYGISVSCYLFSGGYIAVY